MKAYLTFLGEFTIEYFNNFIKHYKSNDSETKNLKLDWVLESNDCVNESWEVNDDNDCQPKLDHFRLQCRSDGMRLEMDSILIPHAEEVFLGGDCKGTFDSERKSLTCAYCQINFETYLKQVYKL